MCESLCMSVGECMCVCVNFVHMCVSKCVSVHVRNCEIECVFMFVCVCVCVPKNCFSRIGLETRLSQLTPDLHQF